MLFFEFFNFIFFIVIAFVFSGALFCLSLFFDFFFYKTYKNLEKLSPYECGFQPFGDAREVFDIRFYLVAILFIIFDLEIAFMMPWLLSTVKYSFYGMLLLFLFLLILTIGFFFE